MSLFSQFSTFFGTLIELLADPTNWVLLIFSSFLGIVFGALPGLTATLGVALLTTFAALDLLLVGLLGELLFRAGDGGYRRPVRIYELPETS